MVRNARRKLPDLERRLKMEIASSTSSHQLFPCARGEQQVTMAKARGMFKDENALVAMIADEVMDLVIFLSLS